MADISQVDIKREADKWVISIDGVDQAERVRTLRLFAEAPGGTIGLLTLEYACAQVARLSGEMVVEHVCPFGGRT